MKAASAGRLMEGFTRAEVTGTAVLELDMVGEMMFGVLMSELN